MKFCFLPHAFAAVSLCVVTNLVVLAFVKALNKTLRSVHFDVVVEKLINCKCGGIVRNEIS